MHDQAPSTRPFGWRDKLGYAAGDMGNDITFVLVSTFFMVYATNIAGINPVHLGFVLLAARLADAFYDLFIGRLADTLPAGATGRFRPWLLRVPPFIATTAALSFIPFLVDWPYAARLAWVGGAYFFYGLAYSTANIPYGSLASVISPEPVHRSALSVFRAVGALTAGLGVLAGLPLVVYRRAESGRPILDPDKLFIAAIVCGVLAILFYAVCFLWVRERVEQPPGHQHASFSHVVTSLGQSRALASLIGAGLCLVLTIGITQALLPYVFLEYFRAPHLQALAALSLLFPTVVLAPLATKLGQRFGKKELAAAGTLFSAIGAGTLFVTRTHDPLVYLGMLGVIGLGQGVFTLLVWAFVADVIDDHEVRTGARDDATVYATYSWARKVGQAVSSGVGSWILGWLGYRTASGGHAVEQSDSTLAGLYAVSTLGPALLFLGMAAILAFVYPLTRNTVTENAVTLAQRRHDLALQAAASEETTISGASA